MTVVVTKRPNEERIVGAWTGQLKILFCFQYCVEHPRIMLRGYSYQNQTSKTFKNADSVLFFPKVLARSLNPKNALNRKTVEILI